MRAEKLTVLIVGGGGREHALYRAVRASPRVARAICAPGNGGIPDRNRRAVRETDFDGLLEIVSAEAIDFVVVGPEFPLVNGIVDRFSASGIPIFGPSKAAAELEGSKAFAKTLCREMNVSTAEYMVATSYPEAEAVIARFGAPVVVKADGLCAGKGVTVAATVDEALQAARLAFVENAFGAAGERLVIERCLSGPECSVVAICDGEDAVLLPAARDYKRAFDGDKGPNTGGMGAYAPLPDVGPALLDHIKATIIRPILRGMARRGNPYHGALYAGLMLTADGPQVIEFNCRFGDPETQVMLPLLRSDIVELMLASVSRGGLSGVAPLKVSGEAAVCVVLSSRGYPGAVATSVPITGVDEATRDALIFHAGTRQDGPLVTSGGRVLACVGIGATHAAARSKAYAARAKIDFAGMQFRTDIAARLPAAAS